MKPSVLAKLHQQSSSATQNDSTGWKGLNNTAGKLLIRLEQLHHVQSCTAQLPDFKVMSTNLSFSTSECAVLPLTLALLLVFHFQAAMYSFFILTRLHCSVVCGIPASGTGAGLSAEFTRSTFGTIVWELDKSSHNSHRPVIHSVSYSKQTAWGCTAESYLDIFIL